MTYSAYVQQIRLEHAERLLLAGSKTIDEIAQAVGYHNKGYFYRIFQAKNGMTPAAYRTLGTGNFCSRQPRQDCGCNQILLRCISRRDRPDRTVWNLPPPTL